MQIGLFLPNGTICMAVRKRDGSSPFFFQLNSILDFFIFGVIIVKYLTIRNLMKKKGEKDDPEEFRA